MDYTREHVRSVRFYGDIRGGEPGRLITTHRLFEMFCEQMYHPEVARAFINTRGQLSEIQIREALTEDAAAFGQAVGIHPSQLIDWYVEWYFGERMEEARRPTEELVSEEEEAA